MNICISDAFVFLVFPVKILLMPERHMITVAFTIGLTILDLKKHFSLDLRVPSDIIQITLDGKIQKRHLKASFVEEIESRHSDISDSKRT